MLNHDPFEWTNAAISFVGLLLTLAAYHQASRATWAAEQAELAVRRSTVRLISLRQLAWPRNSTDM